MNCAIVLAILLMLPLCHHKSWISRAVEGRNSKAVKLECVAVVRMGAQLVDKADIGNFADLREFWSGQSTHHATYDDP